MEEPHKIHKDVPFGYWVLWVDPALKALSRRLHASGDARAALPRGFQPQSGPR